MEKRQNFKRQLSSPDSHALSSDNRELLDRLVNENWELRQLVCPLSEDCLSVEDYLQKVEARERVL